MCHKKVESVHIDIEFRGQMCLNKLFFREILASTGSSITSIIFFLLFLEDSDDDTETDSDDFDEEDIPEFKMVFVVNMSLEMGPGKIAAQVGHAALGVQRVLSSKAKSGKYKLSTTDLGLWQDFG